MTRGPNIPFDSLSFQTAFAGGSPVNMAIPVHRQKSERPIKALISNLVKAVDIVSIGLRNFFSE
jgi:hypothetical protein